MRWFIVFLIVANVILFFWAQQQNRPSPSLSELPAPDVGHLHLVNGQEEAEDAAAPVQSSSPAPETEGEPVSERLAVAIAVETAGIAEVLPDSSAEVADIPSATIVLTTQPAPTVEVPLEELATAPPGFVEQAEVEAGDSVDEDIAAADQSVAQAQQAADEVEKGEVDVEVSPVEQKSEAPETAIKPPVTGLPKAVCARVGPFEPDDADKLISRLPAYLELLSDVSEEYARVDRYYVLIPALPSRAAGRQKLKELADAGFTDTWLFPSGEYRNAISLGFFSREGGARRHAANIAKKGFVTEVKEKTSIRQRRWLFLKNPGGSELGSSLVLPQGSGVEPQACP